MENYKELDICPSCKSGHLVVWDSIDCLELSCNFCGKIIATGDLTEAREYIETLIEVQLPFQE